MTPLTRRIRVIAPGAAVDRGSVETGSIILRAAGHEVTFGNHLFDRHRYLAGTLTSRVKDLQDALEDDEIDIVWFARGGYGSCQIFPHLSDKAVKKVVIGYSDNSGLLAEIERRGGSAIHGPVFSEICTTAADSTEAKLRHEANEVLHMLTGNMRLLEERSFDVHSSGNMQRQSIHGPTFGGNLTTLCAMQGTPWSRSFAGGMLLLEDVGEPYYRLERMLVQLIQGGTLEGVKAVVLGSFHNCPRREVHHSLEEIFAEHMCIQDVPFFTGAPFGHGEVNRPWRIGALATLNSGRLVWNE